ncbi:MAG TPA: TIGR03013 family XrtA/PEP-CTERM system glycosyltransferase [Longimicrobiales bacterium]
MPRRAVAFIMGEGLLIFAATWAAHVLLRGIPFGGDQLALLARSAVVTVVFQLALYYFDLYEFHTRQRLSDMAVQITQAWGAACIALGVIYAMVPATIISLRFFITGLVIAYAAVLLWRAVYVMAIEHRVLTRRVLVLGSGEQAERIVAKLEEIRDSGYAVVAQVGDGVVPRRMASEAMLYTEPVSLSEIVRRQRVEEVVVALDERRGRMPVRELMECKLAGRQVTTGVSFFEGLTGTIPVENMSPSWLIFSDGFRRNRRVGLAKRLADVVLSLVGLVLALPVLLLSALLIKLESRGPVFYRQTRVGLRGADFEVVKFRSMREDAERDGPAWAVQDDPRVTRYGAFMRKTRIDELPQLWNILRQDMSFVGPRPERPAFVRQLEAKLPYYSLRHTIRPGLTGWAQINYPYGASEEDALRKLEYDLYYVKNMNIFMDAIIILRTIKTVLFRKGGR